MMMPRTRRGRWVVISALGSLMVFVFLATSQDKSISSQLKELDDWVLMEIPRCKCSKWIPKPTKFDDGFNDIYNRSYAVNDSTCATETFVRGPGQKVIGFTFYEARPNATKVLNI